MRRFAPRPGLEIDFLSFLLALCVAPAAFPSIATAAQVRRLDPPSISPVIVAHIVPQDGNLGCAGGMLGSCAEAVVQGPEGESQYVYVLVSRFDHVAGLAGVHFGVLYDARAQVGIDIVDWTSCASVSIPDGDWPASRSGISLSWESGAGGAGACPKDSVVVAGYFEVVPYFADRLYITPHPSDQKATVTDCFARESILPYASLGTVGFGPANGSNPCRRGTPGTVELSGRIVTLDGTPLAGTRLDGFPFSPITNAFGDYAMSVPFNWSGVITPSRSGYTFDPVYRSYAQQTGSLAGQSFLATAADPAPGRILLSLDTAAPSGACGSAKPSTCQGTVTHGSLAVPYYAYVLVANSTLSSGVGQAQFGISYDATSGQGVLVHGWTGCSNLEVPEEGWPGSGSAIRVTWDPSSGDPVRGCQRDSIAVAGYLYMTAYSTGLLSIIASPKDGTATLAGCGETPRVLSAQDVGTAGFGGAFGTNPCFEISPSVEISGEISRSPTGAPPSPRMLGLPPAPAISAGYAWYRGVVPRGWSGAVTPVAPGWNFSPASRPYVNIQESRTGDGFVATPSYTPPPNDPKLLLHLGPVTAGSPCSPAGAADCREVTTEGNLATPYFAYILATTDYPDLGIAGVQLGITYDSHVGRGVDVSSWTLCGALEFPDTDWPASGTGNQVTWNARTTDPLTGCRREAVAVAGYLYMTAYSADRLAIVPRPVDGLAKVANCGSVEATISPEKLGALGFGGRLGSNPCLPPFDTVTISGRVATSNGTGLSSVVLAGLPGSPRTDSTGSYRGELRSGWTGTVTPSREAVTFDPPLRQYTEVTSGLTSQDYLALVPDAPGLPPDGGPFAIHALPNPATDAVRIEVESRNTAPTSLDVLDVQGRVIRRLVAHSTGTATVSAAWDCRDSDGRRCASGVYYIRCSGSGSSKTVRVVVRK